MSRTLAFVVCAAVLASTSNVRAQINPAGFLDPAGANCAGTANPPNTTIGPVGGGSMYGSMYGSTLPPGAPGGMSREIETNPAFARKFAGRSAAEGTEARGRARTLPGEDNGDGKNDRQGDQKINLSERQSIAPVKMAEGPATGKLAADWRDTYFQGRHWYWMPNNTWDVWHNAGWVPYKPRMFSQPLFGYGTQVARLSRTAAELSIWPADGFADRDDLSSGRAGA